MNATLTSDFDSAIFGVTELLKDPSGQELRARSRSHLVDNCRHMPPPESRYVYLTCRVGLTLFI